MIDEKQTALNFIAGLYDFRELTGRITRQSSELRVVVKERRGTLWRGDIIHAQNGELFAVTYNDETGKWTVDIYNKILGVTMLNSYMEQMGYLEEAEDCEEDGQA